MIIKFFRKLYNELVSWFSYHIKFSKAVCFISGLIFAHGLVEHTLVAVLITYLTSVLDLKLPQAAKVVNVQEGLSSILVIFTAHLSFTYLGHFRMIVLATIIYMTGLGLFCTAAYVDSIENKILFVALFFLVLGLSGRDVPLKAFLFDQLKPSDPIVMDDSFQKKKVMDDEVQAEIRQQVWWNSLWSVSTILGIFVFATSSWRHLTVISATTMFAGLFCFLLGISFYKKDEPNEPTSRGPLTTSFRVFKAAILKRHLKFSALPNQNERDNNVLLPTVPFFRWLDKADIPESSSISEEELQTDGKLCTVTEVKEVKLLLKMIPMWTAFLVYSLVGASGNTFFFEQASVMDDHLGEIKHVPVTVFVMFKGLASFAASYMCKILLPRFQFLKTRQPLDILVQIGLGMMCSLFCCIAGWRVESFRLNTGNVISVFWLTPQFVLLGCMEGFAEEGLNEFFEIQVAKSMRNYGPAFNELMLGIGKFISAILIFILKDWFGEDVDSSRLDRYYEFLALLSLINFFLFVCTAVWYGNQHMQIENGSADEQKENEDECNLEDGFADESVSPLLSDKLPKSSFQSSGRSVRRVFTVTGCEKEVELNEMRSAMNTDLAG